MASRNLTLNLTLGLALLACLGDLRGQFIVEQNGIRVGVPWQEANVPRNQPPLAGLNAFTPQVATSRVRRALMQYEALVADAAWDEAIDLVEQLQIEKGRELVAATEVADESRFVTVAERCRLLLTGLPPEGLAVYRRRVESTAQNQLTAALATLDEQGLKIIAKELFASKQAESALLALAELALDRGDTAAARRYWRQLHAELQGPEGMPIGVTLSNLAPSVNDSQLSDAWNQIVRETSLLTVPDAEQPLHETLARLIVVSITQGDRRRATNELRLLRALAPDSVGRLAGRDQSLVPALEAMLAEMSDTVDQPLPRTLQWSWTTELRPSKFSQNVQMQRAIQNRNLPIFANQFGGIVQGRLPSSNRPDTPTLSVRSLVVEDSLLYVEGPGLRQFNLATGTEQLIVLPDQDPSVLDREQDVEAALGNLPTIDPPAIPIRRGPNGQLVVDPRRADVADLRRRQVELQKQMIQRAFLTRLQTQPRLINSSLAGANGILYAQYQRPTVAANSNPRNRTRLIQNQSLIGVDLRSDAKLVFELPLNQAIEEQGFQFWGTPIVGNDRLYVMLRSAGFQTRVVIGCYALPSGRTLWTTDLGSGQMSTSMSASPLQVAGDTVYVATGLGAVAALDKQDGTPRWLSRYPRLPAGVPGAEDHAGCQLLGDLVFVAPPDSAELLALSATEGRTVWVAPRLDTTATLVGVTRGSVVVSGHQLASYDPLTGQQQFLWPESERSGIRGSGSAIVAGDEIFWPTRNKIFAIHAKKGGLSRPPIDLAPLGGGGANLTLSKDRLVVAGSKRIGVLGPRFVSNRSQPEPQPVVSRLKETSSLRATNPFIATIDLAQSTLLVDSLGD